MRRQYLEELLTRTKWQNTFIFNGDYEKFIEVLEEREELIHKIEEINKEEGISWSEEECTLLEKIHKLNQENSAEFIRQMEEAREELKKLNKMMVGQEQYINPYGQVIGVGMNFDGGQR